MNGKHTKQYIIGNDHIHIHNKRYQPNTLINQSINHLSTINQHIHYFSISQLIHLENTIYLLVTQKFFVAKNMWQYCKLPHMKYRFMYVYIYMYRQCIMLKWNQTEFDFWILNIQCKISPQIFLLHTRPFFNEKNMNIFLLTIKMNEQGNVKGVPKSRHTDIFSIPSNIPGMSNGFLVVLSCKSVS